ncbi:MAG: hypothetical protein WC284_18180 [Candidimonas sp.]
MRLRLGFEIGYMFPQPTPLIALLTVHHSHVGQLERPDHLITMPVTPVAIDGYRDLFGNWCSRMVAPEGAFTIGVKAVIRDGGLMDPVDRGTEQHRIEDLPPDTLIYLLGSRYCETDRLADEAWRLFQHTRPGWERVQAVCDFVNDHIQFGYAHARGDRSAVEVYADQCGVCGW